MEKKEKPRKALYIFLGLLAGWLIVGITVLQAFAIEVANDKCFIYDFEYCNVDGDCDGKKICITKFTSENVRLSCTSSTFRINTIVENHCMQGFCAEVSTLIIAPDGTEIETYIKKGTQFFERVDCPAKDTNEDVVDISVSSSNQTAVSVAQEDVVETNTVVIEGNVKYLFAKERLFYLVLVVLLAFTSVFATIKYFILRKQLRVAGRLIKKKQQALEMRYKQ